MKKPIECISGGLTLRGMLHLPDNRTENIPLVIMCHGLAGVKTEARFLFASLSKQLEQEGVGSVRFDFRGNGESDGQFIDMTIGTLIEDIINIRNFVKTLSNVDQQNVHLLGYSQGGLSAAIAAPQIKNQLKSLTLWAPAAVLTEEVHQGMFAGVAFNKDNLPEYIDVKGLKLGRSYLEEALKIDAYEYSKGFDKPVLIVHGTKDAAVPYEYGIRYKDEVYTAEQLTFVTVEGSSHTFEIPEYRKQLLDATTAFISSQAKRQEI